MSIRTNSAKTPSNKARKGTISVRLDSGSIKACFPRTHFADEKQLKLATGIPTTTGWDATANKLQRRLQLELEEGKLGSNDGSFNVHRYREILEEYGLRAKLRVVKSVATTADGQLPPKLRLNTLEVWDMYCEYKKAALRETTYINHYQGQYRKMIIDALEICKSDDAIKIRNWIVENRNHQTVKVVLSLLSKAYQLSIRRDYFKVNPYEGLAEEIVLEGAKGKNQSEIQIDNDADLLNKAKAYTWEESKVILNYILNRKQIAWQHNIIKFKFLTGCRTGEAIGFMFGDIFWDKEEIVFRRTYDRETKKLYPLKNHKGGAELSRRFPMPKDGELWNLLKAIPTEELNQIIFKSKTGKIINSDTLGIAWRGREPNRNGIIPSLIKEGKLKKYLPLYNTRHTFITHQIFDLGRDEKIVSAWCGHGEMISQKHYQDIADRAVQINPDKPKALDSQLSQKLEVDLLKEQLEQMRKMIEELQANK